jgi:hypothetical protein
MNKILIPAEQGDVTLIEGNVPAKLLKGKRRKVKGGRAVLAYGEVTGHHHSLDSHKSYILDVTPDLRALFNAQVGIPAQANILDGVLVVGSPDVIKHQEHAPIEISPGVRWIVIEQEYTPGRIQRTVD